MTLFTNSTTNIVLVGLPRVLSYSTTTTTTPFSPTTAAAAVGSILSPAEKARLSAFASRTGIHLSSLSLLQSALCHTSFSDKVAAVPSARFRLLGAHVLGFYVSEWVYTKYPDVPADVLNSVIGGFTSMQALASVGRQFGVAQVMRWKGSSQPPPATPITSENEESEGPVLVVGKVVQSLMGAMYVDQGPLATRAFIRDHILSRAVDIKAHLDAQLRMQNPKALLVALAKKLGKERPVARLIKETGRLSATPVYIVGIYCGVEKVGESYGSSLKMAESRACKDALERYFLAELKGDDFPVPSEEMTESLMASETA